MEAERSRENSGVASLEEVSVDVIGADEVEGVTSSHRLRFLGTATSVVTNEGPAPAPAEDPTRLRLPARYSRNLR